MIRLKRVYDKRADDDGSRVLVDRKWPQGIRKEAAALDYWAKELTPSDALFEFFHHDPKRWMSFRARFRQELKDSPEALKTLTMLAELSKTKTVTLLFSSRDLKRNSASVVRDALESLVLSPLPRPLRDAHVHSTRRRDRARLRAFPTREG